MKLEIFDSVGVKLNVNDLVKIQHKRNDTLTFIGALTICNVVCRYFSEL